MDLEGISKPFCGFLNHHPARDTAKFTDNKRARERMPGIQQVYQGTVTMAEMIYPHRDVDQYHTRLD